MSGKLPIDRVREARDAPSVYDDNRERYTQKQARLEQEDLPEEGERPPETSEPTAQPGAGEDDVK